MIAIKRTVIGLGNSSKISQFAFHKDCRPIQTLDFRTQHTKSRYLLAVESVCLERKQSRNIQVSDENRETRVRGVCVPHLCFTLNLAYSPHMTVHDKVEHHCLEYHNGNHRQRRRLSHHYYQMMFC